MKKVLCVELLCALPLLGQAQERDTLALSNPLRPLPQLRQIKGDTTLTRVEKLRRSGNIFKRFIKAFDEYDTLYIEPNKYNWTVMLQGTTMAEKFALDNRTNPSRISFRSHPGFKVGPYLGWRFIFLGYTYDVTTIGKQQTRKTEFELSLYSSMLGADLFYRRTGNDFQLRKAVGLTQEGNRPIDLTSYYGRRMEGISVSLTGANVYYITNHRHFSHPAAFAQSTVQRISAGSWKFGLSVTQHRININAKRLESQLPPLQGNNPFQTARMKYTDYSLSAGYAYNWVFRPKWLFSVDLAPAIGYKRTHRSLWVEDKGAEDEQSTIRKFLRHRGNVNFNVTSRFALVWNNSHQYAGLSFILHNFNYKYKDLSMHNTFFTFNVYTGLNFIRKKGK